MNTQPAHLDRPSGYTMFRAAEPAALTAVYMAQIHKQKTLTVHITARSHAPRACPTPKQKPLPDESYNTVLGTQTIGAAYQFAPEPKLLETARAVMDMGLRTIKFSLADDKDHWPLPNCRV